MLFGKYLPLYAPEVETGADTGADPAPPPVDTKVPMNDRPVDGPGSGRSALKRQLEEGFEKARKDEPVEKPAPRKARGPNHQEEPEVDPALTEEEDLESQLPPEEVEGDQPVQKLAPPASLSKEAKAEWEKTPPTIQAAIIKREQDVEKGIGQLKQRYNDIDQALAPRLEMLRKHNQTPAQGIDRLFKWMEALAGNPDEAFPALIQSFGYDPNRLFQVLSGQQPTGQEQPQPGQDQGEIPAALKQYIGSLEQKLASMEQGFQNEFGALKTSFQSQTQAKTAEILDAWSKEKTYFEEVRETMGRLMLPGPNGEPPVVAPLPNGNADLDKAYETAIWAIPEVRAKVIADQRARAAAALKKRQEDEKKAQADQAAAARRAGGSLSPSAPGLPGEGGKRKGSGKSVRESLSDAIKEARS